MTRAKSDESLEAFQGKSPVEFLTALAMLEEEKAVDVLCATAAFHAKGLRGAQGPEWIVQLIDSIEPRVFNSERVLRAFLGVAGWGGMEGTNALRRYARRLNPELASRGIDEGRRRAMFAYWGITAEELEGE